MKTHLSILIATLALAAGQPALASIEDSVVQEDSLEARIDETKKRLDISDEQDVKFTPVVDQHMEERTALFEKYGLNEENATISFRNLRAFRSEIRKLNGVTRTNVSEILSEEQLEEWDVIQEENREEIRESIYWE